MPGQSRMYPCGASCDLAGQPASRKRCLEIVATRRARDVDQFSGKEQAPREPGCIVWGSISAVATPPSVTMAS